MQVIEPYIACKRAKSFIDRFLLGHNLESYLHPRAFGRLNALEKCLLAGRIEDERAKAVARVVRDEVEAKPTPPAVFEQLFRTAISSTLSHTAFSDELNLAVGNAMDDAPDRAAAAMQANLSDMMSLNATEADFADFAPPPPAAASIQRAMAPRPAVNEAMERAAPMALGGPPKGMMQRSMAAPARGAMKMKKSGRRAKAVASDIDLLCADIDDSDDEW